MKKVLLFDLDGTLTDSAEGICNSIAIVYEAYGLAYTREELKKFIGPPLTWSFPNYCGFDEQETEHAIDLFRGRYSEIGIYENRLYDGIEEMLSALKGAGYRLGLATSKPEHYAVRIIEHFHLTPYFEHITGSNVGESGTKEDVVRDALARFEISPADAWMIGDREHDMDGGHAAGVDTVGVLWGYGSREELSEHGAAHIAATTEALVKLLT